MIKVDSHNSKATVEIEGNIITLAAEVCSVVRSLATLMAENSSMTRRQAVAKILKIVSVALQENPDES